MSEILEFMTVNKMENSLRNSDDNSAHQRDGIILLRKWKSEKQLKKTEETEKLIDKLLHDFNKE